MPAHIVDVLYPMLNPLPETILLPPVYFISHLLGFGYTLYCLIYWASASSGMSGFEKLGADFATIMVIPHVVLVVLATLFNTFALFSYHRCFSITSAILYCAAILFAPLYFYFVIVQAILCFIAFFIMESKGKVPVGIKGFLSAASVLCAVISVGILFSNIGTIEDNKKAEASRACLKNKSCTKHIFPRPFS